MLRLYLDESGSRDDPALKVVSVGGLLGSLDAWNRFESGWAPVLREFGISELHMKDFVSFRNEFAGWTEPKRRALLDRLFALLETSHDDALLPIASVRPVIFYREGKVGGRISDEEAHLRGLLGEDPLVTSFRDTVSTANDEMMVRWTADEQMEVIFDDRPTAKQTISNAFEFLKERRCGFVGAISFVSSKAVVSVQAADFVAYESAKRVGDPGRVRGSYQRLRRLGGYLPE